MPVHILPPDVIAKIAAGEVVERPASVVKELVENSIDAGAQRIEVHLKDAGKDLIRVKDDGRGIAREDLERLFNRHATSKITGIEDLEALVTMGFRGEALYSIGAVSDVTVRTQLDKAREAWSLTVKGGERGAAEPSAPTGRGTDIEVRQLFFNVPARRKFLKSPTAELNQIIGVALPYALLYPAKALTLTHMGRALLDLKPAATKIERAAAALNIDAKDLIEGEEFKDGELAISMVLGSVNVQRPRRDQQFIFVNRRPVESRGLGFAVNDAYRLVMPSGVNPAFILEVELSPALVDANVHPAKREVRIKDEGRLIGIVRSMVERTLMERGPMKTFTLNNQDPEPKTPAAHWATASIFDSSFNAKPKSNPNLPLTTSPLPLHDALSAARFIGSFRNKYLLFESGESLLLVDQHAAQERIMFERFRDQLERSAVEVQSLLTPVLIKLSAMEKLNWEASQSALKDAGIEATFFDADTLAVQTQPVLLKNIEGALRSLLAGDGVAKCDHETLARRACKASVRTGDTLTAVQVEHQRQELLACQDPFTCPHGRPTTVELKTSDIDRSFLRM